MRILVMLLLDTLPMLGNVLLLCFFVFFIFGIIGVQLWEGISRMLKKSNQTQNHVNFLSSSYYLFFRYNKTFIKGILRQRCVLQLPNGVLKPE